MKNASMASSEGVSPEQVEHGHWHQRGWGKGWCWSAVIKTMGVLWVCEDMSARTMLKCIDLLCELFCAFCAT